MKKTWNEELPLDSPCRNCTPEDCDQQKGGPCILWEEWFRERWQGFQASASVVLLRKENRR